MLPEPELIKATLVQFGCPYPAGDARTTVWLEGYQKGMNDTMDSAMKSFKRLAGEKS